MFIFFILAGIFAVTCTYFKPAFYWDSRKAHNLRKIIGDQGASILYYIIGSGLIIFGVTEFMGISTLL